MAKKEPRWAIAFLRALERTGVARTAAKDAGIDWSTAYGRRRAHPDFAERWAEALRAHAARVKADEEAEIEALKQAPPSGLRPATSPANGGEDVVISGGKVRRVGYGRWSKAKERIFFEALAGNPNLRRAADAAGVSTNTIRARRLKNRVFAAKFEAVVRSAKAGIDLYLIEQARKTFDPDEIDMSDERPRVSIDQAIRISQMLGARLKGAASNPFHEEESRSDDDEAVTQQLISRLRAFTQRLQRGQMEAGWTRDESYGVMIPPGYVQGPDYRPKPPDESAA